MKMLKLLFLKLSILFTIISCAQNTDKIIGVWEVDNEYYKAVYEIVEVDNKFYGKIHKYDDGKEQYVGSNSKEDYFLTDVELKGNRYENGKMYLPDGSYYEVIFTLINDNALKVEMTIENYPYSETWTRKL